MYTTSTSATTIVCLLLLSLSSSIHAFNQDTDWESAKSLHDFHMKNLAGENVDLSKYKGKVVLFQVGSTKCPVALKGFRILEKYHQNYSPDGNYESVGFIIDGLMATQSSGTAANIKEFIKKNSFSYDFYDKIEFEGPDSPPLYKWMRVQPVPNNKIPYNAKALFDKDGKLVAVYPYNEPMENIEEAIKQRL